MYRREDDIIIIYNLTTLIYLPIWLVMAFVYQYEFPPPSHLASYSGTDRVIVFIIVYVIEYILGFALKLNKYIVILCNLITFYLLIKLAGYFFLEAKELPITYCFIFVLVTVAAFLNILIELSEELKNYLLLLEDVEWFSPMFTGYRYEAACKKYWIGIVRLFLLAIVIKTIYYWVNGIS